MINDFSRTVIYCLRNFGKENIKALIDKYGPESNVVRVRVHGLFPLAEDDVFIPITMLEKSIATDIEQLI